jgi:hypothetical protein
MPAKQDPKRLALLLGLLVVLVGVVIYQLRPTLMRGVLTGEGKAAKVGSYQVPNLGWNKDDTRHVPSPSSGRSLFTYGPPPTPTPDLRPTPTPRPTLPPPPPPPPPTPVCFPAAGGGCLPAPPRFPLSYLGWLGPNRLPVAVFRDGEKVVAVARGDTVKERFIIREVGPTSVIVGFTGYAESVTSKVPLAR